MSYSIDYKWTDNSNGIIVGGNGWTGTMIVPSTVSTNQFFALACIALGLNEQEQRDQFIAAMKGVSSSWTVEQVYDFMIATAYRIKYGDEERPN